MTDLIRAAARNMAAWQDGQLRAHGLDCRWTDALWSCGQRGPVIYLGAITLAPGSQENQGEQLAEIEELVALRRGQDFALCDSWMDLELRYLGFEPQQPEPWYVRPPGPRPAVTMPEELELSQVTGPVELAEFERASVEGFGGSAAPRPHEWHSPASLGHPNMPYFAGRIDGRIVSVSIACVSDGVVGIYGVATLSQYRRRGYGGALTWAAIQTAPHLPAVLEPSSIAAPLYRSMGFGHIGEYRHWRHRGQHGGA